MSRGGRRGTRKLREARPEDLPPKPQANAKTKLCRYNTAGKCVNGALCDFAHSFTELQLPDCHGLIPPALPTPALTEGGGSLPNCCFARPLTPTPEKPSWASAYEASEADDLSTCFSDGEGSGLSSCLGFSQMSLEDTQRAAEEAEEEEDTYSGRDYAHARLWRGSSGVTVKNTFLQFGVSSYGSSSSSRRTRSAT